MKTTFTHLFGIVHPVMQAPVGGAAGPELASAVSNAGGLGSLVVWSGTVNQAAAAVSSTRTLTSNPFSVNVRADLEQAAHIDAVLSAGAPAVHLFWGDPRPYSQTILRAGAKLICTVASADEAKVALDAGASALVAQGWEAGGHVRGTITTMTLVPTVADLAGAVPVLAAGGISTGRHAGAAFVLGAAGVVLGTRFVASLESRAHQEYKELLVSARQSEVVYLENLFDVGWPNAPHRVLRNSTVREWEAAGRPATGERPNEGEVVARRADGSTIQRYGAPHPTAGSTGRLEALALYAGQGVEQVRDILPAATIIEDIMRDVNASIRAVTYE